MQKVDKFTVVDQGSLLLVSLFLFNTLVNDFSDPSFVFASIFVVHLSRYTVGW